MDEDCRTTGAGTYRFLRGLGIGGLAIVASLGLAGRVHATYLHSDCAPAYAEHYNAGDYIDRGWYYLLDEGQFYYLDRGQYELMVELGYLNKLRKALLNHLSIFHRTTLRGVLSFYNGQTQAEGYLRLGWGILTQIRTKKSGFIFSPSPHPSQIEKPPLPG